MVTCAFTCGWPELAGDFGEELEGEAGPRLSVTEASLAAARLAAFDPVRPEHAIWEDVASNRDSFNNI